jgi:adenylosuccinate lyase
LENLSREELKKLVQKQMMEAQKQMETAKKEAEESAKQAEV